MNQITTPAKRVRRQPKSTVTSQELANVPRVLLQQNSISHYRQRVFEVLSRHPDTRVTVVADTVSETPFLKTIDGSAVGIRHRPVRTRILRFPPLPDFYWQAETIAIAWRERPDLIIALGSPYSLTSWVLCFLGRARQTPVLLWTHGLLKAESGLKWWIRRAQYRLATGLLLYGDHAKQLLTDAGFDPVTLHVVYNSLDTDEQQRVATTIGKSEILAFRKSLGLKRGVGLVTFTGRLQPVKHLDLLVQAIGKLAERGKRIHACLVGEGSERVRLSELASQLGIADRIHFLGAIYDEPTLGRIYTASDLAVIPSGAGLSIMHAMAYGTPVLIHDRVEHHFPEWEAVEADRTGLFYQFDSVDDLAHKIESVLASPSRRARMSRQCKAMIYSRYNPYHHSNAIIQAIFKALKLYGHSQAFLPIRRQRKPVTNGW